MTIAIVIVATLLAPYILLFIADKMLFSVVAFLCIKRFGIKRFDRITKSSFRDEAFENALVEILDDHPRIKYASTVIYALMHLPTFIQEHIFEEEEDDLDDDEEEDEE